METLIADVFKLAEEYFLPIFLVGLFLIYGLDYQIRRAYGRTALRAGPIIMTSIAGVLAAYGVKWSGLESDGLKAGALILLLVTCMNIRNRGPRTGIVTSILQAGIGSFIGVCSVIYLETILTLIFLPLLAKSLTIRPAYYIYPLSWGSRDHDDGDRLHDYRGNDDIF